MGAGAIGVTTATETTSDGLETHASVTDAAADDEIERVDAVGVDGYTLIGGDDQDGIEFPECPDGEGDDCVEMTGDVDPDTGTYTVSSSQFHFPTLTVPDTAAGDVDATVEAPDGIEGELDPETGAMTMDGTLEITAETPLGDCEIDLALESTTGDSGSMSGDAFEPGAESTEATLVANEFAVAESDGPGLACDAVDGELNLPSPEGDNEFELESQLAFEYADDVDRIEGQVFDESTEYADGSYSPVAEVTVGVAGTDYETETDETGEFSMSASAGELGDPGESVTLEVEHDRYRDDTVTATFDEDGVATADAILEPDWGDGEIAVLPQPLKGETGETLTMPFEVESLDRSTDRQVDGFTMAFTYDPDVVVFQGVEETDWESVDVDHSQGSVTVTGTDDSATTDFTAFTAEFELIGDAGDHAEIAFEWDESELIEEGFLGIESEYDASFSHTPIAIDGPFSGGLEGEVTDEDGEPVADATVEVGGEELTTDDDGTYATELEVGEYDVDVSHDEFEDRSVTGEVVADATASADVTLGVPTGVVEGEVTDADGEPVEGATVTAGDQQTTTDADGSYDIELEVGEYDLEASAGEFESDTASATVDDSATTAQDFTLEADDDGGDDGGETAPDDDEFDADEWADWLEAQAADFEDRYFERVVDEINIQAEERTDGAFDQVARHDHVNSPAEAREEAEYVEDTFGDVSEDTDEAVEALEDAADTVEDVYDALTTAAEDLRNADDPLAEVDRINDEVIAGVNADIDSSNEELENVEGVDHVPTIDADEDPEESSDGDDDEVAGDVDEDDAMGAALQSFGVVIAVASLIIGMVSTIGASRAPVLGPE